MDHARTVFMAAVNLAYNRPQDAIPLFKEGIERLKEPNTIEEEYYLASLKREYRYLIGRLRRKSRGPLRRNKEGTLKRK